MAGEQGDRQAVKVQFAPVEPGLLRHGMIRVGCGLEVVIIVACGISNQVPIQADIVGRDDFVQTTLCRDWRGIDEKSGFRSLF